MDLRQLKCFIAVAEEMHFGRAAERLHVAPTAMSRSVRALEEEIGTPLLQRTTRAVILTKAGLSFLEDAKDILARTVTAAQSAREMAVDSRMTLRIGAIDSASASILPLAIKGIIRKIPTAQIQLIETMTAQQIQMLRTGRIDLALIRLPATKTEFPFETLRTEKLVVLLQTAHPLAQKSQLEIKDIVSEPLIIPSKRARPYAYDLVMAYFATAKTLPHIIQETTEKPAIMAMVAAGLGIALVPDWVATMTREGICYRELNDVKLDIVQPGAIVGMSWRNEQQHSLRNEFMNELRQVSRDHEPQITNYEYKI